MTLSVWSFQVTIIISMGEDLPCVPGYRGTIFLAEYAVLKCDTKFLCLKNPLWLCWWSVCVCVCVSTCVRACVRACVCVCVCVF